MSPGIRIYSMGLPMVCCFCFLFASDFSETASFGGSYTILKFLDFE